MTAKVARHLLTVGRSIRAVVRDARKAATWKDLGCDVAVSVLRNPHNVIFHADTGL
jgi:uncharacterized protein YbjT (DUF2867 family)